MLRTPARKAVCECEAAAVSGDGDLVETFARLERAHSLGRPWAVPQLAHSEMLEIGRRRHGREVAGQRPRRGSRRGA